MKSIVDILAIRRINTANDELSQVLPISPLRTGIALRRHHPLLTLHRQTVQYCFPKRPIGHFEFEQQALLLCIFALRFSQCANEVTLRVPGRDIPSVDGNEDFLSDESRSLAGTEPYPRKKAGDGGGEYSLL